MTSQQRDRVWAQRVQESCGGEAGNALATQMAATFMVCSYTQMRSRGFRMTPVSAGKLAGLGGVFFSGALGYFVGSSIAGGSMGNSDQYYYLIANKRAIVNGSAPLD